MHNDSCNSKRCVVVDLLVAALLLLLLQCWTGARESATSPRIQRSERLARQRTATVQCGCDDDKETQLALYGLLRACCARSRGSRED
jgi:hypothetical protein